ncbi:PH domain-containing protein [Pseudomassariella vexata]|uniref:PH domain-containing protein n=1 Tax=Pseudomassariella vexata TaxID=1141098 RepID=A0A1Y2EEB7_9PEZI|nr:PH domain-containing protein [Pseudomassariella vexata]ORY69918.1 PH domain-containing protein [Pseudomassariella vexata]
MADTATQSPPVAESTTNTKLAGRGAKIIISPSSVAMSPNPTASRLRSQLGLASSSPVNQNGSFEFDRVIKTGYVQKRTQKTKTWKTVYLVLRPNALSIYKSDKESKLRHKIYLSELSAVALLKDPKQRRHNLFGLFSPAKNFHFQAPSASDAQEWLDLIRQDARIEEEEEEMFLASPVARRQSYAPLKVLANTSGVLDNTLLDNQRISSSPEPIDANASSVAPSSVRRPSHNLDYSGISGNELGSHSDFSDNEVQRVGASMENLAVRSPGTSASQPGTDPNSRPAIGERNTSQLSGLNIEQDPDRVVWQGWLMFLKSKRGVRQWKHSWAVLRPRNLILYKDESEYSASFIMALAAIVNVVDIDPVSKTKLHCMQIITDERSYRFCAHDEENLLQCLGAFKSLLSKRKDLEARQKAAVAPR